MALSLSGILLSVVLFINALAILNEDRFLKRSALRSFLALLSLAYSPPLDTHTPCDWALHSRLGVHARDGC